MARHSKTMLALAGVADREEARAGLPRHVGRRLGAPAAAGEEPEEPEEELLHRPMPVRPRRADWLMTPSP